MGADITIESIESNAPPRPGITFPESFTFDERLKSDSDKSPIIEDIAISTLISIIFTMEPEKTFVHAKYPMIPETIAPTKPPKNPAILLFGLTLITPLLFFPKRFPKSHARLSHIKTINKKMPITAFETSVSFL